MTTAPSPAIRAAKPRPPRAVRASVVLFGAGCAGLAAGASTLYLQGVLPGTSNSFANSGAVWTALAFAAALVGCCVRGIGRAVTVAAGAVALLAEVIGYYAVAAPLDSIATARTAELLWVAAAMVVGPPSGAAAWYTRRGTATARTVSLLSLLAVAMGEGVYLVRHVPSAAAFGRGEIALAVAGALTTLVLVRTTAGGRAVAVLAAGVVSTAVLVAYSVPFFV